MAKTTRPLAITYIQLTAAIDAVPDDDAEPLADAVALALRDEDADEDDLDEVLELLSVVETADVLQRMNADESDQV